MNESRRSGAQRPKAQRKSKSQIAEFVEAARALECDESEAAFARKLKVIAKAKPAPGKK